MNTKKIALVCAVVAVVVCAISAVAFADADTPVSLLDATMEGHIEDFAADIVPTVLAVVGLIIVPVLTLFAIRFGWRTGMGLIKRAARL